MGFLKVINYWVLGGFEGEKSAINAIKDAKAMNMDGIELTFGDCLKEDITESECLEILNAAKEQGVALKTLATGAYWGCSLASENEEERQKAIQFTLKYLQVAAWLNVDKILVVPGAVDVAWDDSRPVVPYQTVWDNATTSLRIVLKKAEELKINVCLENVWNKFLLSPVEFKFFLNQFESDYIGIYLDVGNVLISGYPEDWIQILNEKVKAVHVKNFTRTDAGGSLSGFGDNLNVGDLNYDKVIKALHKIKYDGPITVEMIPFSRLPDLVLPDMELAKQTASDLIKILAKVE
jgi:L-ribulose-5-phosphate 3-epimerase